MRLEIGGDGGAQRIVGRRVVTKDRKSTRLNSSHSQISYAVFCLKKKNINRKSVALVDHTFRRRSIFKRVRYLCRAGRHPFSSSSCRRRSHHHDNSPLFWFPLRRR